MRENISSVESGWENHEKESVEAKTETKTMNRENFSNLLYSNGDVEIADRRFRREGSFKYFDPDDLMDIANKDSYFSFISVENKIAGICKLQKVPGREKSYWISFLSVDPNYRDKGYARKLLEEVFQFSKDNDLTLVASSYSDDGYVSVKKVSQELSKKMNVPFEDTEGRI